MAEGWRDFLSARVRVLFKRRGRGTTSGLDLEALRSREATSFHLRDGRVVRLALYFEEATALADEGL